jgi:aryl-alcohol dehydrogenase-like predicted oxidoreductase
MQYAELGRTGIRVSRICLGTMTFGQQNSEADAHRQLDAALEAGVNFIDTAEMYPFPATARTQGLTETFIGSWMKARRNRPKLVVATKITGPSAGLRHIRGGELRYTRAQVRAAVDGSLKRLQTNALDLYQLHWPERSTNFFGDLGYAHVENESWTPFEETLAALAEAVASGKVRAIGVSNETPWGLMKCLGLAESQGFPRVASIQNPYSLLCRVFEIGLAEPAIREDCGLLAYSPLAFGALTGKYLNGRNPPGARFTLYPSYDRYFNRNAVRATDAYVALARRFGLDPAQMAIAYVLSRPFVTAAIVGATALEQLATDLAAADLTLPQAVVEAIEKIHLDNPNPAP